MKPILFSTDMVRAILDDRKTETRRVVKPQPPKNTDYLEPEDVEGNGWLCISNFDGGEFKDGDHWRKCPYGQVGGRLWVRETWMPETENGIKTGGIIYRATDKPEKDGENPLRWRPSIHMPKSASRITLEITDIQIERVQDITEEGARAEGVSAIPYYLPSEIPEKNFAYRLGLGAITRPRFARLWDSINEKRGYGWNSNPFVWVIKFRRIT